jgi:predicted RNA-binding Zn-ribbon protein involved in translation (DUF1610 family)
MVGPRAGVHYPRSTGELQAWFRTDADCLDYLEWLRWPVGFSCPDCGHPKLVRVGGEVQRGAHFMARPTCSTRIRTGGGLSAPMTARRSA